METLFKKHFWLLQSLAIIIVALLLSSTANSILGAQLVKYTVAVPEIESSSLIEEDDEIYAPALDLRLGPQEEEVAVAPTDPCDEMVCQEGEICDTTTGNCVPDPDAEQTNEEEAFEDSRCLESDIRINLVGTMVAADPEWSVAILHNPTTGKTELANLGDFLLAHAEVLSIERSRVMLRRNEIEECLRPGDQAERAARRQAQNPEEEEPEENTRRSRQERRSSARNEPEERRSSPSTLEERIQAGIQRERSGHYSIDRSVLEEITENQSVLQAQAPDVTPSYENGRPTGFRLDGIQRGSMFQAIGVRNGDIIRSVNGTTIDSPQRAAELFDTLMSQNSVQIVIRRRGRDVNLNYNIR